MCDVEAGLTQFLLKQELHYDPETGIFTWIKRLSGRAKAGNVAGTVTRYGYVAVHLGRKNYFAHRLAWLYMTGKWPTQFLDHKDLNRRNNRWENLREASSQQNNRNTRRQKNNTSGYKGVNFDPRKGEYRAQIYINKKQIWLGYHATAELAYVAYLKAQQEAFGDFARAA